MTKYIRQEVIEDAISVCWGLSKMNARYAVGYAFVISNELGKRNKVYSGEFIYYSELDRVTFDNFDGYIDIENKTLKNLETEEIINLNKSPFTH